MPKPSNDRQGYVGAIAAVKCGIGGLARNLNPSAISLRNVIQAEGVVFRQDHWRKEPGSFLFGTNNTGGVSADDRVVVALVDWHPTESIQRIVHLLGDGHLYFTVQNPGVTGDPAAVQSTHTSGSGTRFGYFVQGGNDAAAPTTKKLFLFRDNLLPSVIAGDVTNDVEIANPAADWSDSEPPIVGLINGPRLWAAGNTSSPHALYASADGDQEDFTTSSGSATDPQILSIFPGVGQRIMGLTNYRGFIVVFKYPRGIMLVDARDADPINWIVQMVTDSVGIAPTPYSALQMENDVLFIGNDGQFYLLSAVISAAAGQNNMAVANIGMNLEIYQFLLEAYSRGNLGQLQSVYQPFWQTATFTVTGVGSETNNTRLVFDFTAVGRKGGDPRFAYSYRDKAASLAIWRDPNDFIEKPIFGDYMGNIIELEQESRTAWDGAPYPMRIQTPHSNFGEFEGLEDALGKFVQFANRNKQWDQLELEYLPFTSATVNITIFVDGVKKGPTIAQLVCDGGRPLGFTDTDTQAFIIGDSLLAGGVTRSRVIRTAVGDGRRVSYLFENEIAGQDVAITHLYVFFRNGDTSNPRFC